MNVLFLSGDISAQPLDSDIVSNLSFANNTGAGISCLSFNSSSTIVSGLCERQLKVAKLDRTSSEDIAFHALSINEVTAHAWPVWRKDGRRSSNSPRTTTTTTTGDNRLVVGTMDGNLLHIEVPDDMGSDQHTVIKRSLLDTSTQPQCEVTSVAWLADGAIVNTLAGYKSGCVVAGYADGTVLACSLDGGVEPQKHKLLNEGISR